MSKRRNNKYRKIYEDYYGIEIPAGMDIHHIDEDRENNDIANLLMLPKDIHSRYHIWKREFDRLERFDGLLLSHNQYAFTVIAEFGKVCEECVRWMGLKSQLEMRKMMGDVHG